MALTRKFLKALGLDEEKIDEIISAHSETVDALKNQRDSAQIEAAKLTDLTTERDRLKDKVDELTKAGGDAAKIQADFDAYKQQVEGERAAAKKRTAIDTLLREAGVVKDSFRATLLKTMDTDSIELDDAGAVKDADTWKERIRTDNADFITSTEEHGTPPITPPTGSGKVYTREQIRAMSPEEINKNWDSVKDSLARLTK